MTPFRKMNPNLMIAAGLAADLNDDHIWLYPENAHVSHSEFTDSLVPGGVNTEGGILRKQRPDREVLRTDAAFDNRNILPPGAVILELLLQLFLRLDGLRKDEQP